MVVRTAFLGLASAALLSSCGSDLLPYEEAVIAQVRHLLQTPEIIARTWAAAKPESKVPEREVVETITAFAPRWEELFPAE